MGTYIKKHIICIIFVFIILGGAAIDGVHGDAMVTGTVFCDQCKDGHISLFDYPLFGVKVKMACPGDDGQLTEVGEESTDMLGNYAMRMGGTQDLSTCFTQISGDGHGCAVAGGEPKPVKLMFRMFDMEIYTANALLSQPAQPMPFCSSSSAPVVPRAPPPPMIGGGAPGTPERGSPTIRLPPMPPLPALPPLPPMPFLEASACSHEYWTKPEYKCNWKIVGPETKVGLIFGPIAAHKYGPNMTLWTGLQGKGSPYTTLLREATTALLNSYSTLQFPYSPVSVVQQINVALVGRSPRRILLTALRFMRANSGRGKATCKFKSCK